MTEKSHTRIRIPGYSNSNCERPKKDETDKYCDATIGYSAPHDNFQFNSGRAARRTLFQDIVELPKPS